MPTDKDETTTSVITVVTAPPERPGGPPPEACLVVLRGDELGRKYTLARTSTLIGRSTSADVYLDQNSASRSHAVIENYGESVVVRDLESTNGTYVNDARIRQKSLEHGDVIQVGRTFFKFLTGSDIEEMFHDEIFGMMTTDGLTGAYNKRHFLQLMERELSRSFRYERDLSLIMTDIDHFKQINDTWTHLAGDLVLRQVAKRIAANIRRDDLFGRYGGEEFILLLPELSKDQAARMAEKLRSLVEGKPFQFQDVEIGVTLSLGVAELREVLPDPKPTTPEEIDPLHFIQLADERLFEAKEGGRNRVCC